MYVAEVWGVYSSRAYIEKVQLFALKRFLGIDQRVPNDMVLGDTGRYSLEINCYIRALRCWLKIIRWTVIVCHTELIKLDEKDKNSWATKIRLLLYTHGFAFVWESQGVQGIKACYNILNWYGHLTNSQRFEMYKTYKTCFATEMYLTLDLNKHDVNALTRFRTGLSITEPHKNRYKCLSPEKIALSYVQNNEIERQL